MTTDHPEDDALTARLRDADPAASLPPVTSAEVARLLEDAMTESPATPRRGRLPWLVAAAAAVVVLGGVGAVALMGDDGGTPPSAGPTDSGGDPTVTELKAPGTDAYQARCMVPRASVLEGKPTAFSGTVESVEGDVVTLVPDRWYAGDETDLVEVQGPTAELSALLDAVQFEDGERYLVAADESGDVMVCGFSAPYAEELAAIYEEAFAS